MTDNADGSLLPPGMTLECSPTPVFLHQRVPVQAFSKAARVRKCPDTGALVTEAVGDEIKLDVNHAGSIGVSKEAHDLLFK